MKDTGLPIMALNVGAGCKSSGADTSNVDIIPNSGLDKDIWPWVITFYSFIISCFVNRDLVYLWLYITYSLSHVVLHCFFITTTVLQRRYCWCWWNDTSSLLSDTKWVGNCERTREIANIHNAPAWQAGNRWAGWPYWIAGAQVVALVVVFDALCT